MKSALRGVPGVVEAKRLIVSSYRLARPLRPPVESAALVARMLEPQPDDSFISGNGLAARCRYVLNYDTFKLNDEVENDWWFCNPEFLEYFFRQLAPREPFVLFTHNSNVDRPIGTQFASRLDRPELTAWFATQAALRHPKLFSFPLGVGNHVKCKGEVLKQVQQQRIAKSRLFEASFDVRTNTSERRYCIEQTGIEPEPKRPAAEYYERLASSYFCLSPNGNGVDCYRTWQALSLRTIPVVTRSLLTEQHPDLPMIVLEDWAQFRSIDFSPELYEEIWGGWNPECLGLDEYLQRVEGTISVLQDDRAREPASTARGQLEAPASVRSIRSR